MKSSLLALPLALVLSSCGGAQTNPTAAPTPAGAAAPSEPPHWSYEGEHGPDHWGDLSDAWATCKTGKNQTPIDIVPKSATASKTLAELVFTYAPQPLVILNNGHTVQVNATAPSTLATAGATWRLAQLHFHAPSEHTIDGKHFDAELHVVHQNDAGAYAVIGLFLEKGKENAALAPMIDHAPMEATKDAQTIAGASLDLSPLLPKHASYWAYSGSLTTPPCTEGVSWFVLETPATISDAQLAKLRAALHGETARPLQPLGARAVTSFE